MVKFTRRTCAIIGGVGGGLMVLVAAILAGVLTTTGRSGSRDKPDDDDPTQWTTAPTSAPVIDENDLICDTDPEFEPIPECPDFKILNSDDGHAPVIPSEVDIGQAGDSAGVKPLLYNLTLNIVSKRDFTGHVDILTKIRRPTNSMIVDADLDALQLAGDEISIRRFCPKAPSTSGMCLSKIYKLADSQTVMIVLNDTVPVDERFVLTFGSFTGGPLTQSNDPGQKYSGSIGLRLADKEGETWALTTIFQMRYARTVFPCFDHPGLKAAFRLVLERANETVGASNTPRERSIPAPGQQGRVQDTYQQTPPIPSYVFTFSVMSRFAVASDAPSDKDKPAIDLYYPDISQRVNDTTYHWIFQEARQIMEGLERATNFTYKLPKLGFINVNPAPFWGIENYGLVTLESGFSRYPEIERGHTILVHEIVHQWLGDVITISAWQEICLQEGLTAYFEWKLSEALPDVHTTLSLAAKRARAENMRKDEMNVLPLIRPYNKTDDIAEVCFGKPPLIFHMIADAYGADVWERFLAKLLKERTYGNADFDTWIATISAVTGTTETGEFLRQWFNEPGHPILYADLDRASKKSLRISQGLVFNNQIDPRPKHARRVPMKLMTRDDPAQTVLIDSLNQTVQLKSAVQWVLLDPEVSTFTRKAYDVHNYRKLLGCLPVNGEQQDLPGCEGANRERIHEAYDDFCFALLKNVFPWGEDKLSFDEPAWNGLLNDLHDATAMAGRGQRQLQVDRACECCFRTKAELDAEADLSPWHPNACKRLWNDMCLGLDIMKMTGRNYTAPERAPSGR